MVLASFLVALMFQVDPDTWLHDRVGRDILSTHICPARDTYSFTAPGTEWMAYEWLADVALAGVKRAAGFEGWMELLFSLAGGMTLLIYYYAYLACRNPKAAFAATALVLPLAGVWFTLHPQLCGYVFLVITLICLEHFRQGRRAWLWLLPLVFLVWVNTHGTFIFGLAALVIYWLSGLVELRAGCLLARRWSVTERIQMAAVALASLLACCITPYGTRLLTYPAELVLMQPAMTANMVSWQSIPFNVWHGQLFLAYVLLFITAAAVFETPIRLEALALFFLAVVMTALHARALPLFAIVFAPMLASLLARWAPRYEPDKDLSALNAFLIIAIVAGVARGFPSEAKLSATLSEHHPQGAASYLRAHPETRGMFNELSWGGYLLDSLGPEQRVFIDCRIDIYEYTDVFEDYLQIMKVAPETLWLLEKYHVHACLMASQARLATLLGTLPEWKKVYGDRMCVLFVRSP